MKHLLNCGFQSNGICMYRSEVKELKAKSTNRTFFVCVLTKKFNGKDLNAKTSIIIKKNLPLSFI